MGPHSYIGHGTVVKDLTGVELGEHATIGTWNWITCFRGNTGAFSHLPMRDCVLALGHHSAITNRHIIDCNARIEIGPFSTVAGYGSQLLTHSIDIYESRQHADRIAIGSYCFIGTNCTLLGGARIPDRTVLGAGSVLGSALEDSNALYAGVPARFKKALSDDTKYFQRSAGNVL